MRQSNLDVPLLRMLVYGAPGTGKTRFIGTFDDVEDTRRVLILNAMGNPSVLASRPERPFVFDVSSLADVSRVVEFFSRGQPADHPFRSQFEIPREVRFNTIAIDTLTELQQIIVYESAGVPYDVGVGVRDLSVIPELTRASWGGVLMRTTNVVRYLCQLPVHVVFVTQERAVVDERLGQVVGYAPALQGASAVYVPAVANLVGRMVRRVSDAGRTVAREDPEGGRTVSVLFLDGAGMTQAKNQLGVNLGSKIIDPKAETFIKAMKGGSKNERV